MPIRKRADRFQVRVSLGDGRRVERTLPAGAKRADAVALEATLRRAVIDQVVVPGERSRDLRLTSDQVRRLMNKSEPRLADFLAFLALTGLRRSEALRLTPADVVGGAVRVDSRSMSGRPRLVPLAPEAAKIAAKRLPFDLTVPQIVRLWIEARKAARMPGVRLHDLRHYFGSLLVERGADAATVLGPMGHSSLSVTSRYVHGVAETAARAVRGLSVGRKLRVGRGSGRSTVKEVSLVSN